MTTVEHIISSHDPSDVEGALTDLKGLNASDLQAALETLPPYRDLIALALADIGLESSTISLRRAIENTPVGERATLLYALDRVLRGRHVHPDLFPALVASALGGGTIEREHALDLLDQSTDAEIPAERWHDCRASISEYLDTHDELDPLVLDLADGFGVAFGPRVSADQVLRLVGATRTDEPKGDLGHLDVERSDGIPRQMAA